MSTLILVESGTTPTTPSSGKVRFWVGTDGVLRSIDDAGSVTIYNLSQEAMEDYVGNLFQDSSTINVTYNDAGNAMTLDVIASAVDHDALLNFVTNKHIDHSTVSISAGTGLTGGGDITTSRTISMPNTGTAGTYKSVTTDAQGRVTAGTNPTTLAEYGITDAQPLDTDLTALAGLSANGIIARTGDGTASARTITAGVGISVTDGDGVAGNPTISTTITQYTDELAQDASASMLTGATHDGVSVSYNDAGNTLAITNTDKGSSAVTTHEAALDPHTQYTTAAEAAAAAPVQSVAGKTGTVTLDKNDVGLGNVDNTTDLNKPISTATQTALNLKQNLLSGLGNISVSSTLTGARTSGFSFFSDDLPGTYNARILRNAGENAVLNIENVGTGSIVLNPASKIISCNSSALTNVLDPTTVQGAATKNYVDTNLATNATNDRNRTNHTGTQLASTISDFTETAQDSAASMLTGASHTGVSVSYNDAGNTLAITNTDGGTSAVSTHVGLADPHAQYVLETTTISAGTGLSGGGDLTTNRTISMPNTGTAGTYGSATAIPVMTTDAQGRVSSVTDTNIAIPLSQITQSSATSNQVPQWNGSAWVPVTLSGGGSPGGSTTQVQYNNSGSFAGAANVAIDSDDLVIDLNTGATSAPTDFVKLFNNPMAGRGYVGNVCAGGVRAFSQNHIGVHNIAYWMPPGGATNVPGILGVTTLTATGTGTARSVATTNTLTRARRLGYVSAATAGALSGPREAVAKYTTGDGSNNGGFAYTLRFGISDAATVAGARMFVGLANGVGAPTNVEPNTLLNCIGVAQLSTDSTQLYLVHGGSTAQTEIALGSTDFPISTTNLYQLNLFSPPNALRTINYEVRNISNGTSVSGSLSGTAVQIPSETTLMGIQNWRTNNATLLAVGLDICSIYVEVFK